ncbi:MAG TPA: DUF2293 domain-containing protein [Methylorubrum populi]|uniref:DUF2293 domain-containing protein n=1 Tax=Methylorubrum populi TaxID=223967 RepID=A0A921JEK0_9HYPH|nr:DUF2293 domain-containing protein [Methylorubrum populi]
MKKGGIPDRPVQTTPPLDRRSIVAEALSRLAPRLPEFEAEAVLDRAMRSPGLRGAIPETAAWLALTAFARHTFTEYDDLLADGYDRDSARHFVLDDMNAVLAEWGCRRRVSEETEEVLPDDVSEA